MPELYIITGSNGAGKSTVGSDYLPHHIQQQGHIFDGDKLFMQKRSELWKSGIKSHKECKKLAFEFVENTFDNLVENALAKKNDFTYEGHFTNEATWDVPRRFKSAGYSIHLIFFGLRNTDLSELRVIARSQEGGHYVDPRTLNDNFYGNLEKLDLHFAMFDSVQIVDTSEAEHKVICVLSNKDVVSAIDTVSLPDWFRDNLKIITAKISRKESN
jgi:predicted ABC-type ATPase